MVQVDSVSQSSGRIHCWAFKPAFPENTTIEPDKPGAQAHHRAFISRGLVVPRVRARLKLRPGHELVEGEAEGDEDGRGDEDGDEVVPQGAVQAAAPPASPLTRRAHKGRIENVLLALLPSALSHR